MATATNDNQVQSAVPTGLWGTISHFSVHKSATGGTTYVGFTPLTTNRTPAVGQRLQFAAGAIDVVINDQATGGEFGAYGAETALEGNLRQRHPVRRPCTRARPEPPGRPMRSAATGTRGSPWGTPTGPLASGAGPLRRAAPDGPPAVG